MGNISIDAIEYLACYSHPPPQASHLDRKYPKPVPLQRVVRSPESSNGQAPFRHRTPHPIPLDKILPQIKFL